MKTKKILGIHFWYIRLSESFKHSRTGIWWGAVMSSGGAGVQGRIKQITPLALYTQCYSHCLSLFIVATSKVQEPYQPKQWSSSCSAKLTAPSDNRCSIWPLKCPYLNSHTLCFQDTIGGKANMPRSVSWNWIYDVQVTFLDAIICQTTRMTIDTTFTIL